MPGNKLVDEGQGWFSRLVPQFFYTRSAEIIRVSLAPPPAVQCEKEGEMKLLSTTAFKPNLGGSFDLFLLPSFRLLRPSR